MRIMSTSTTEPTNSLYDEYDDDVIVDSSGNVNDSILHIEGPTSVCVGRQVIDKEIQSLIMTRDLMDSQFDTAVDMILNCTGRLVVIGVGKSGIIGKKISATMSSLGTRSFFLHATECAHGDLGSLAPEDIVLAISNSGETPELLGILPTIRMVIGAKIISITGNKNSKLAQYSTCVLYIGQHEEADPGSLAPTCSTVATLAIGDALAVTLSVRRSFTRRQFGIYHPGGTLGHRVLQEELLHHQQQQQPTTQPPPPPPLTSVERRLRQQQQQQQKQRQPKLVAANGATTTTTTTPPPPSPGVARATAGLKS
eukprot:GEZU01005412.1.p1 GENE.GEZU01005412.1~~GEZU01005412.1.p1  ORF type:complete len:338 (-),score=71.17 GEZU01005412.1:296-1228(-)